MSWSVGRGVGGGRQPFGAHGSHHLAAACVLAGTGNIQPFVWLRSIPKASGFSFTTVYTKQRRGLKRRVLLFRQKGLNYIPESCYTKRLKSPKRFPPQLCFLIRKTPVARNINYPELRIQFLYHLYSVYNSLNKGLFTVLLYLLQGRKVHYIVQSEFKKFTSPTPPHGGIIWSFIFLNCWAW